MSANGSFVFLPEEIDAERQRTYRYWLEHCEGFRVESPNGRLGVVQDVRRSLDDGAANALVVRGGLLGRTVLIVPPDEVERLVPREERLVLHANPQVVHPPAPPTRPSKLTLLHGAL